MRRSLNESKERNETTLFSTKQQTHGVSNVTGRLRKYSSGGAYVDNWVKWPERESDLKTIIKCGHNEWGYNSKPLQEYTVHLNGCSAPQRVRSYHGHLNFRNRGGAP
jgi:hypothetical protein